jgi:hypothetical protein
MLLSFTVPPKIDGTLGHHRSNIILFNAKKVKYLNVLVWFFKSLVGFS